MNKKNLTTYVLRIVLVLAVAVLGPYFSAPSQASASSGWTVVGSPDNGANDNLLIAVSAASSSDIWAVGDFLNYQLQDRTLIEHWNGTQWRLADSPNLGSGFNSLTGVSALTATDAWAVGEGTDATGLVNQTLVEHWNGGRWRIVPSPNASNSFNELVAVTAIAANDVWAVGNFRDSSLILRTLIEHWDGTSWSVVPSPNVASLDMFLNGVAAVSATDVWAVGEVLESGSTLTLHWDGTSWSIVPSPNGPANASELFGVTALATHDVWAVGTDGGSTLAEHWNGTNWTVVATPSPVPPQRGNNGIFSVTANSSTDVWAIGYAVSFSPPAPQRTLTLHWDGVSWTQVHSPNLGSSDNFLASVTSASGTLWAVGRERPSSGSPERTLVLRNP